MGHTWCRITYKLIEGDRVYKRSEITLIPHNDGLFVSFYHVFDEVKSVFRCSKAANSLEMLLVPYDELKQATVPV